MIELPNNIEIEKGCLSCAILNKQSLIKLLSTANEDDFFNAKCQWLFKALKDTKISDIAAIREWYSSKGGQFDISFWTDVCETVTSSESTDYLIKQLIDYSTRRKTIKYCQSTIDFIAKGIETQEVLKKLSSGLREINLDHTVKIHDSKEMFENKDIDAFTFKDDNYIKTGIHDFDEMFHGLLNGEFVLIAGRPSQGKSVLAMDIAMEVSKTKPALYISLEMPKKFFTIRMLSNEAHVNSLKIQHNTLDKMEKEKAKDAIKRLAARHFYLIDKARLKNETIDSVVRSFYAKYGLALVIVDYLQIMGSSSKESRYIRIGEDSTVLKALAKDLDIPVIAVSSKSRDKGAELLASFRESGNLEFDADKGLFLEYDNWDEKISDPEIQGKIIVGKNKYGSIGFCPITFYKAYSKFI